MSSPEALQAQLLYSLFQNPDSKKRFKTPPPIISDSKIIDGFRTAQSSPVECQKLVKARQKEFEGGIFTSTSDKSFYPALLCCEFLKKTFLAYLYNTARGNYRFPNEGQERLSNPDVTFVRYFSLALGGGRTLQTIPIAAQSLEVVSGDYLTETATENIKFSPNGDQILAQLTPAPDDTPLIREIYQDLRRNRLKAIIDQYQDPLIPQAQSAAPLLRQDPTGQELIAHYITEQNTQPDFWGLPFLKLNPTQAQNTEVKRLFMNNLNEGSALAGLFYRTYIPYFYPGLELPQAPATRMERFKTALAQRLHI